MKVGDIVRITDCDDEAAGIGGRPCNCFFCRGNSNRLGLVTEYLGSNDNEPRFNVRFDIGHWTLFDADITRNNAEVISVASR
jgi:hypothetical protein